MKKHIALITRGPSDLGALLQRLPGVCVRVFSPGELDGAGLDRYEAFCILGGTQDAPLVFAPAARLALEAQREKGKRFFCEYVRSIGDAYCLPPAPTRYLRLAAARPFGGLEPGTFLDEQANSFCALYEKGPGARPLLVYRRGVHAHACAPLDAAQQEDSSLWGLWQETEALLVCAFRLCDFARACFAPAAAWRAVVAEILQWLTGLPVPDEALPRPAAVCAAHAPDPLPAPADAPAAAAAWLRRAGMLCAEGAGGVCEGLQTEISPDGARVVAGDIRADCCAEAGFFLFAEAMRTGEAPLRTAADALEAFCFDSFLVQEGPWAGMLRWTNVAWAVCYPDDAARVLLPSLFKMLYTGDRARLGQVRAALGFLLSFTGPDGLVPARIDIAGMTPERQAAARRGTGGVASAHYTAYYHAALLLCHRLTGEQALLEAGRAGLSALMARYPGTVREHSETQEMCRLVLPLAMLYWATGEARHREWLYRVARDLERLRHESGAHLEWDTGYTAACSRRQGAECSLLCENGDPVADLLYSVNWLPMAYTQAYLVTGDAWFMELWRKTAGFLAAAQLRSSEALLDGAWARGCDVRRMEVYANPYDTGWGPCAVETGWTVAEIGAGLSLGSMAGALRPFYERERTEGEKA